MSALNSNLPTTQMQYLATTETNQVAVYVQLMTASTSTNCRTCNSTVHNYNIYQDYYALEVTFLRSETNTNIVLGI